MSSSRQKALDYAQTGFTSDNLHPSYMEWRKLFRIWQGFYDGSGQWVSEDILALAERGQLPITVNLIQAYVDSLLGVEIQTRHRAACRNSSGKLEDEQVAAALTQALYNFQQSERIPYKCTQKARDMFIGGIGWSEIGRRDNTNYYNYIPALNIVPDFDDLTNQFDNQRRLHRKIWLDPEHLVALWPHAKKYLGVTPDFLTSYEQGIYTPEIDDRKSDLMDYNLFQIRKGKVMVVETQYKVPKKAYRSIDSEGKYFQTFSEEDAEKLSESKKDIEEYSSTRIMRTLFIGNCLLEHAPLVGDIPDRKDFSYIPAVWKRRYIDGVPYGLVQSIMDIQRDCNARLTKSIYLLNSNRIILEGGLDNGSDIERIRKELKKQDSVIVLPQGSKFEVSSNAQLGLEQMKVVQEYLMLMQKITGINDEMLGFQTNATSAVSQEVRTQNALRKNIFAFDTFRDMKLREAMFFLEMLQSTDNEALYLQVLNEENQQELLLNFQYENFMGQKVDLPNIKHFPLSLYIEEVPDYESMFEEESANMQAILNNPNAQLFLQSPTLLKYYAKVRQPEKIVAEIQRGMQIQNGNMLPEGMPQQGGMPQLGSLPPMPMENAQMNLNPQSM
jgi:hypothetical protein